jgi:hypothetical protein
MLFNRHALPLACSASNSPNSAQAVPILILSELSPLTYNDVRVPPGEISQKGSSIRPAGLSKAKRAIAFVPLDLPPLVCVATPSL